MRLGRLIKRANAARLATHLIALWKLFRHADTPRAAKIVALLTLAYAVSPIDLIPDFIPVLGALDDIVLIPLGIALAVKLTPPAQWQARLAEAEVSREKLPSLKWGALIVALVWLLVVAAVIGGVWALAA